MSLLCKRKEFHVKSNEKRLNKATEKCEKRNGFHKTLLTLNFGNVELVPRKIDHFHA